MQQQHLEGPDPDAEGGCNIEDRAPHMAQRRTQRTTLHAAPPSNADERRGPGTKLFRVLGGYAWSHPNNVLTEIMQAVLQSTRVCFNTELVREYGRFNELLQITRKIGHNPRIQQLKIAIRSWQLLVTTAEECFSLLIEKSDTWQEALSERQRMKS
ncbi:hypothetical protein WN51_11886 [Melipona quadrifasciata]|uniref:Uncharacterized protein n=1 Tax=Melipona quadrifasciata TaxID=166423 RepID=A0A0M9A485_9HYME|nr:hypothetical protein WN51_11886 [Melipona quadrifasciata]